MFLYSYVDGFHTTYLHIVWISYFCHCVKSWIFYIFLALHKSKFQLRPSGFLTFASDHFFNKKNLEWDFVHFYINDYDFYILDCDLFLFDYRFDETKYVNEYN